MKIFMIIGLFIGSLCLTQCDFTSVAQHNQCIAANDAMANAENAMVEAYNADTMDAEVMQKAKQAKKLADKATPICSQAEQSDVEVQKAMYRSLLCQGGAANVNKANKIYASMPETSRVFVFGTHESAQALLEAVKSGKNGDGFVCMLPK